MSKFEKYLIEASHNDEEDARENGVTVSKIGTDTATIKVKAVNSKNVTIMSGTIEYINDYLKRHGITKIKYNDNLDKHDSKEYIKKAAKDMKDHQDKSGYTKKREEIWGKK